MKRTFGNDAWETDGDQSSSSRGKAGLTNARQNLSSEDVRKILKLVQPFDEPSRDIVVEALTSIVETYQFQIGNYREMPTREAHRKNLASLANKIGTLMRKLRAEPLLHCLIYDSMHQELSSTEATRREIALIEGLARAKSMARYLSDVKNAPMLKVMRGKPSDRRNELERRVLWEPVFELFTMCGKRPAASRCGPAHDAIRIIHAALGLADPDEDALQKALRRYKSVRRDLTSSTAERLSLLALAERASRPQLG